MPPQFSIVVPKDEVLATLQQIGAALPAGAEILVTDAAATFASAANAAARTATGDVLVFLEGLPAADFPWAALANSCADAEVGAVGSGGSILLPPASGKAGFALLPLTALERADGTPPVFDCDLLSRECFVMRREAFIGVGGFDEVFSEGDEIFDACLRLRERNLRVLSDARIALAQRRPWPRAADANERRRAFLERWSARARPRPNIWCERGGTLLRPDYSFSGSRIAVPVPTVTILVHGPEPSERNAFERALAHTRLQPDRIVWASGEAAAAEARTLTECRGEGYVAFVRSDASLAPQWLNVLVDVLEGTDDVVAASDGLDAGCVAIAPRMIPQHLRIEPVAPFDAALAAWIERAVAARAPVARTSALAPAPYASIVMLSWNAPEFTETAVASIAHHTRMPHEVILVDNGSDAATRERIARLDGVRVIYNDRNMGFAHGSNQGAAAARGTHVVLLNNDVVVTEGWLEALVGLQERRPAVGVSVPVSNNVHGHQRVEGAPADLAFLPAFAAERARRFAGMWYRADVAMGLCMCIAREVIEEIGGMDPSYGVGNFEDVDYCVRTRAAGYEIGVCQDAFVHHFGSVSFRANGIDYAGQTKANFDRFVERWNVDPDLPLSDAVLAPIRRGFSAARDRVPLPPAA